MIDFDKLPTFQDILAQQKAEYDTGIGQDDVNTLAQGTANQIDYSMTDEIVKKPALVIGSLGAHFAGNDDLATERIKLAEETQRANASGARSADMLADTLSFIPMSAATGGVASLGRGMGAIVAKRIHDRVAEKFMKNYYEKSLQKVLNKGVKTELDTAFGRSMQDTINMTLQQPHAFMKEENGEKKFDIGSQTLEALGINKVMSAVPHYALAGAEIGLNKFKASKLKDKIAINGNYAKLNGLDSTDFQMSTKDNIEKQAVEDINNYQPEAEYYFTTDNKGEFVMNLPEIGSGRGMVLEDGTLYFDMSQSKINDKLLIQKVGDKPMFEPVKLEDGQFVEIGKEENLAQELAQNEDMAQYSLDEQVEYADIEKAFDSINDLSDESIDKLSNQFYEILKDKGISKEKVKAGIKALRDDLVNDPNAVEKTPEVLKDEILQMDLNEFAQIAEEERANTANTFDEANVYYEKGDDGNIVQTMTTDNDSVLSENVGSQVSKRDVGIDETRYSELKDPTDGAIAINRKDKEIANSETQKAVEEQAKKEYDNWFKRKESQIISEIKDVHKQKLKPEEIKTMAQTKIDKLKKVKEGNKFESMTKVKTKTEVISDVPKEKLEATKQKLIDSYGLKEEDIRVKELENGKYELEYDSLDFPELNEQYKNLDKVDDTVNEFKKEIKTEKEAKEAIKEEEKLKQEKEQSKQEKLDSIFYYRTKPDKEGKSKMVDSIVNKERLLKNLDEKIEDVTKKYEYRAKELETLKGLKDKLSKDRIKEIKKEMKELNKDYKFYKKTKKLVGDETNGDRAYHELVRKVIDGKIRKVLGDRQASYKAQYVMEELQRLDDMLVKGEVELDGFKYVTRNDKGEIVINDKAVRELEQAYDTVLKTINKRIKQFRESLEYYDKKKKKTISKLDKRAEKMVRNALEALENYKKLIETRKNPDVIKEHLLQYVEDPKVQEILREKYELREKLNDIVEPLDKKRIEERLYELDEELAQKKYGVKELEKEYLKGVEKMDFTKFNEKVKSMINEARATLERSKKIEPKKERLENIIYKESSMINLIGSKKIEAQKHRPKVIQLTEAEKKNLKVGNINGLQVKNIIGVGTTLKNDKAKHIKTIMHETTHYIDNYNEVKFRQDLIDELRANDEIMSLYGYDINDNELIANFIADFYTGEATKHTKSLFTGIKKKNFSDVMEELNRYDEKLSEVKEDIKALDNDFKKTKDTKELEWLAQRKLKLLETEKELRRKKQEAVNKYFKSKDTVVVFDALDLGDRAKTSLDDYGYKLHNTINSSPELKGLFFDDVPKDTVSTTYHKKGKALTQIPMEQLKKKYEDLYDMLDTMNIFDVFVIDAQREAMERIATLKAGAEETIMSQLNESYNKFKKEIEDNVRAEDKAEADYYFGRAIHMGLHKAVHDLDSFDFRSVEKWAKDQNRSIGDLLLSKGAKLTVDKLDLNKTINQLIDNVAKEKFGSRLTNYFYATLRDGTRRSGLSGKIPKNAPEIVKVLRKAIENLDDLDIDLVGTLDKEIARRRTLHQLYKNKKTFNKKLLDTIDNNAEGFKKISKLWEGVEETMKRVGSYGHQFAVNPELNLKNWDKVLKLTPKVKKGQDVVKKYKGGMYLVMEDKPDLTIGAQDSVFVGFSPKNHEKGIYKAYLTGHKIKKGDKGKYYIKIKDKWIELDTNEIAVRYNQKKGVYEAFAHVPIQDLEKKRLYGSHDAVIDTKLSTYFKKNKYISYSENVSQHYRRRQMRIALDNGILLNKEDWLKLEPKEQAKYVKHKISDYGTYYVKRRHLHNILGTKSKDLGDFTKVFGKYKKFVDANIVRPILGAMEALKGVILTYNLASYANSYVSSYAIYFTHANRFGKFREDVKDAQRGIESYKQKLKKVAEEAAKTGEDINYLIKKYKLDEDPIHYAFVNGLGTTIREATYGTGAYQENRLMKTLRPLFKNDSMYNGLKNWFALPDSKLGSKFGELFDKTELEPKLALYLDGIKSGLTKEESLQKTLMAFPNYSMNLTPTLRFLDVVSPYTKYLTNYPKMLVSAQRHGMGRVALMMAMYYGALEASYNFQPDKDEEWFYENDFFKLGSDTYLYAQSLLPYVFPLDPDEFANISVWSSFDKLLFPFDLNPLVFAN